MRLERPIALQVTVKQSDAASDTEIQGICKKALEEEGRLDVFFANVGCIHLLKRQVTLLTHPTLGWNQQSFTLQRY
jgi:hypothetical protein